MKHSRRYKEIKEKISRDIYSLREALSFLLSNQLEKVSSIRATFTLDWKNPNSTLKLNTSLPNSIKPKEKLAVIREGLDSDVLEKLSSDSRVILLEISEIPSILKKKRKKWGFFKVLAHSSASQLDSFKSLEKIMGPKRNYPNKKNSSLTDDILAGRENFFLGEKIISSDKNGNLHFLFGDSSLDQVRLEENLIYLENKVSSLRPKGLKGSFVKKITISTNMGPGIRVKID